MKTLAPLALAAAIAAAVVPASPAHAAPAASAERPTVILVHGAFAAGDSWNGVVERLAGEGYPVVAAANPLRGVAADARVVDGLVAQAPGPVVLVGHSYGGAVISNVRQDPKIRALVFVAAFAPDAGESVLELTGRFPGSTLPGALAAPTVNAEGGEDLYIRPAAFWQQFAADLPEAQARLMAAAQRPVARVALAEASGTPRWKTIPSWFVHGDGDRNIPAAALQAMADRAQSRRTVVVPGASHVVMTSHPDVVAGLVVEAAQATAGR